MTEATRKKEVRRKAHSAPGSISTQPLHKSRIVKEFERNIYRAGVHCVPMHISNWIWLND